MQITNQTVNLQDFSNMKPSGKESFKATVKEKLSDSEAILTIKGQDIKVKFNGDMPKDENIQVKVVGMEDDVPVVELVNKENKATQTTEAMLPETYEDVEKWIKSKNIQLSKSDIQALKKYLKSPGMINEKIETIKMLVQKQLPFTETHLKSIDEALHGEPIGDLLKEFVTQLEKNGSGVFQMLKSKIQQAQQFSTLNESTTENMHVDVKQQENKMSMPTDQESVSLSNIQEETRNLKEPTEQEINHKTIAQEESIKKTLIQQENIQDETSPNTQTDSIKDMIEQIMPLINEAAAYISPDTKPIVVTKVTEKMAQAANEFRLAKREMSLKLSNVETMLEKPQMIKPALEVVESVINRLDRALTSGDFLLFADMKTEKKMLDASTKLAEAKQLLQEGKKSEATAIVQEVKKTVDSLNFQPADVKVKHFVSQLAMDDTVENFIPKLAETYQFATQEGNSVRHTAEYFKQLGLHHERDVQQAMFKREIPIQNMKSLLISLANEGEGLSKQATQLVANITGHQLLNKSESNTPAQASQIQLPLFYEQQIQTVNVYLNGRDEGGSLDWQNCTMYFLLNSEKYGEIGISLQTSNRQLSLTLKNNNADFQEKMSDLTDNAKETFEDLGYNVRKVQVTSFQQEEAKQSEKVIETKSGEGYDIVI